MDGERRCAVRHRDRARRRDARGHRREGQAVSVERRSRERGAGDARARAAGDDDRADRRSHVHRDRQSGTADVGVVGARDARHVRIRRERRAPRVDVGRGGLARARAGRHEGRGLHALGQHPDAGRSVERVERAVRKRRRLADHEPEGALPAVARRADRHRDRGAGADVPVIGVPAAQHPAAGHVDHGASAGRRVPEAVLERRDRDRRPRRRRAGQARGGEQSRSAAARRRLAGGSFSAGCRPSRGRPTTTTTTS